MCNDIFSSGNLYTIIVVNMPLSTVLTFEWKWKQIAKEIFYHKYFVYISNIPYVILLIIKIIPEIQVVLSWICQPQKPCQYLKTKGYV